MSRSGAARVPAGGTAGRVGRYRYTVATERWWWSPEVYDTYGLPVGSDITTALVLAHQHPDDLVHASALFGDRVRDGAAFATMHRIIDAAGRVRWIVSVGEGSRGPDGAVRELIGYHVDVTDRQIRALSERAATAVDAATASRAAIEQAKGALMLVYGFGPDEAFSQLVWQSQHANIKLRDLAERLVAAVSGDARTSTAIRQRLDELIYQVPRAEPAETAAPEAAPEAGELSLRRSARGGSQIVHATGEVDMATAARLESVLSDAVRRTRPPGAVIVELTGLRHLGSVGVSLLTACQRRCTQAGTGLRVVAGDGPARGVLEMACTELAVYPDLTSALP
jgi:anti-anti-sigma factor